MTVHELQQEILRLKREKNICILAHAYQSQPVLEVADYTGDSYGLSVQAAKTNADGVIMCGVRFMAETCKILSPEKTVWLANPMAGCPMAEQLPKPISSACNCIIIEAMEASSIHTSLTNGSAVTTIANGASAINCDACALQCDSFSSNSLSSTIINCHAFVRLEVGDISAAFIKVTTSSCVNSSSVNFRILRRTFSNSLKFSIYHILLVTYLAHCAK